MTPIFLGIDVSTQGCKVLCIDPAAGETTYLAGVNYDTDLSEYRTLNGAIKTEDAALSESDPNMWIDALHLLFRKMTAERFPMERIRGIAVSGQQHGLVSLDIDGNLTRNSSKLWNDYSTQAECDLLTEKLGGTAAMIRAVGNSQRPGYTAGKIFHMYRHESAAAARTSTFFLVHNFINWYLTGGKKGGVRVMEPGDVSGMALRHPAASEWSQEVCKAISADLVGKLPPVKPADEMIGYISAELIDRYGFSADCQIDAGNGDNMYGAVGTGNITPGIVTISLGTSGTAYTVFDQPYVDPDGEIAAFCDSTGKFLPLLCVSNLANGYNQILQQFDLSHADFTRVISETPPGNRGRMIFPWFSGERTPDLPNANPVYWGFGLEDFTMPVLCRAVLEGHLLNLYDGYRKMPVNASEIRLTGGLSQSDAWRQTIADIFETETVPVAGEGAALGAAVHAAWVYFKQQDPAYPLQALTDQFVKTEESARKKPRHTDTYRHLKSAFSEISQRLRQRSGKANPFQIFQELNG